MARVLVVDDDPTVCEVLGAYLRRAGHEVSVVGDGLSAVGSARAWTPDLVVLDLMLPGIDGLEAFDRMRRDRADLPVIMLTALGEEADRVAGLERGADDYVSKPFSSREVVLRVEALLRRRGAPDTAGQVLQDGDLRLDVAARTASLAGEPLSLTLREFDLLCHLVRTAGQAWSRAELMRDVWGWDFGDESTVTVHVRRLREKVELDPARPTRLVTVWGIGYRWDRDGSRC